MKNKKRNETKGLIWAVIMISIFVFGIAISMNADARAVGQYDFPPQVTMDVEMTNGASGTYQCPDARSCYIKSLEYEARGAEQYCVSLVMKRDGKVIWFKNYQ